MKPASDAVELFLCAGLDRDQIRQLAFETGFCEREPRKIQPADFLAQLCVQSAAGVVSYNDLAAGMEAYAGVTASRQAYWEKTDESCARFFQSVLERVMLSKSNPGAVAAINRRLRFKRILLQDSTIIKLPLRLFAVYSGVKNGPTAVCNARIQGIYDLLSGQFVRFSIDPYSKNDQAAALEIAVQPGDLILRDRGYFRMSVIECHKRAGADSICRYKHPTVLYDPATGEKINLLELLTRRGSVDMLVGTGPEQTVPIRLIAFPVSEETANVRRMRAKKEMNYPPSPELLKLMAWTIFFTTITDPSITFKEILSLYGLRWRIENVFKTWKSHFNFEKIHNVPEIQLHVLLNARLIMITIAYERLFLPLSEQLEAPISLMKFMRYITQNFPYISRLMSSKVASPKLCRAVQRYCTYDKRNRPNFVSAMEAILRKTAGSP